MKKIILLSFITFYVFGTNAQTIDASLKNKYEQEAIYLGGRGQYIKNNQKKQIGFFGKKLNQEFNNSSAEAKQEMQMYTKHTKHGAVLTAVTAGLLVTPVVIIATPVLTTAAVISAGISLGAALTTDIVSLVQSIKAARNLQKAIWLHNRDVVITK